MPVKSRGKAAPTTKKQDAPTPPRWPPLKPLVPSSNLRLETLLEDQIIVIRNFFTSSLCKNYVSFLSSLPLVTTPGQPKKGDAVRVNDRFQVDDAAFAEQLWETAGLRDLLTRGEIEDAGHQQDPTTLWVGQVCGLNPRIRIYRYSRGQFFSQHSTLVFNLIMEHGIEGIEGLYWDWLFAGITLACTIGIALFLRQLPTCSYAIQGLLWFYVYLLAVFYVVRLDTHVLFEDNVLAAYQMIPAPRKKPRNNDDESNVLSLPTTPQIPAKTTWTLLIYLTGSSTGCVGGETVFYPELGPAKKFSGKENDGTDPVVVDLEVGMALLHKHGQDCLLHEGREVTQGEKWVIRSDLCVKR
ncbi:MAG: hypothetical protein Q9216_004612 [Gyalolechia sp. 2 TL-2023]